MTNLDDRSRQEDQALREMAERLEKELTTTQHLLKIAKLHQRTSWPGERTAAAEAFARASRGTPWGGLTPEQFLRRASHPPPEPEPAKKSEMETRSHPFPDQTDERRRDRHETASGPSRPTQQPASQKKDKVAKWSGHFVVFFVLATIAAGAASRYLPERRSPPLATQTSSSGPQTSAAPSNDSALLTPKKANVVAVEPEQKTDTPAQTAMPAAPQAAEMLDTSIAELRAKTILGNLVEAFNGNAKSVGVVGSFYAETVNYYGKSTSQRGVILDKQRFVERWPIRKYTIRRDSLTVDCSGSDKIRCTARGLMDFDASNASKRSTGVTSFVYAFASNNHAPLSLAVTTENSTVISRNVTDVGRQPGETVAAPSPAEPRGQ